MNRRSFFLSGSSVAALVATGGLGISRKLFAQNSDSSVYDASAAAASMVIAVMAKGDPDASQWGSYSNSLKAVANNWQANGIDQQLAQVYASVKPADIYTTNFDKQSIVDSVRIYNPDYTIEQLQTALSVLDQLSDDYRQSIITRLQQGGLMAFFPTAIDASDVFSSPTYSSNPDATTNWLHANEPRSEGGGSGCQREGAAIYALGLAFTVIFLMTTAGFGAPLAAAGWVSVAAWGGVGTGALATKHVIGGCPF